MFNGKIDQLAFVVSSEAEAEQVKQRFGLQGAEWIEDNVLATGTVRGEHAVQNQAKLLFNYDLGIELEILQYTAGANYAEDLIGGSISHIGIHHIGVGEVPTFPFSIIQQVQTVSHSNQFLLDTGRRYRYTIYDSYAEIGVYLKVIERIEPGSEPSA